jgi:polyisoprenoid-binding protein YceI
MFNLQPESSLSNSTYLKQSINLLFVIMLSFLFSIIFVSKSHGNTEPPVTKKIITSTVIWTGKKVGGKHNGTINVKSGELSFDVAGNLIGGEFELDMNSILCTDLSGSKAEKLVGHLKSDDFFGVDKHPTSSLKITDVSAKGNDIYQITSDITIKGTTKQITFEANVNEDTATAQITIDRSEFNVRYGSGSFFKSLGNKAIKDKFTLDVELKF